MEPFFDTGRWSEDELASLIKGAASISAPGSRIDAISAGFLGTPYKASTLSGSGPVSEQLVINLGGVDCFTFIDYVNALRLASTVGEFIEKLAQLRYQNSSISYAARNHFFTDWIDHPPCFVREATEEIGTGKTLSALKNLNLKSDGSCYLEGVPVITREVRYIPTDRLNKKITDRLQTGDFIGIYSADDGLDVSHVGVIIRMDKGPVLRHASSVAGKVLDQDFRSYIGDKPGLIVLRPV